LLKRPSPVARFDGECEDVIDAQAMKHDPDPTSTHSADKVKLFERIRRELADNLAEPPELKDPALLEEYLVWRNEEYHRRMAALKPLDNKNYWKNE
jgi:hypothetical protein